jgi:hypothetical protein
MNETNNLKLQISELQRQLNNKDALILQGNKDIEQLKKITLEYETMKIYYQKKENEYKTNLDNAISYSTLYVIPLLKIQASGIG